jgi:hypothetical protein
MLPRHKEDHPKPFGDGRSCLMKDGSCGKGNFFEIQEDSWVSIVSLSSFLMISIS